jgi:ligand-binding sensor domain-containing protein
MTVSGPEYFSGEILSITEGQDKSLWFQTEQGFSHFDGVTWTVYSISGEPLVYRYFSHSTTGVDGDLWFVDEDGLFHFDGENLTYFTIPEEFSAGGIIPVAVDDDGAVWLPSPNGVVRFTP